MEGAAPRKNEAIIVPNCSRDANDGSPSFSRMTGDLDSKAPLKAAISADPGHFEGRRRGAPAV
jgi:hypothetical protein